MSDEELKKYWEEKNNSYINRVIKTGKYSIRRIKYALPEIIWAENGHIKINKKAPYPDQDECMNGKFSEIMISTNKLILESFGDWQFSAYMVKVSNFSTRQEFDKLVFVNNHGVNCKCNCSPKTSEILSRIPLVDAFEKVGVIISVNMDYLRKIATDDQKDKSIAKLLNGTIVRTAKSKELIELANFGVVEVDNREGGIGHDFKVLLQ